MELPELHGFRLLCFSCERPVYLSVKKDSCWYECACGTQMSMDIQGLKHHLKAGTIRVHQPLQDLSEFLLDDLSRDSV